MYIDVICLLFIHPNLFQLFIYIETNSGLRLVILCKSSKVDNQITY